jgi:hypothetical protein
VDVGVVAMMDRKTSPLCLEKQRLGVSNQASVSGHIGAIATTNTEISSPYQGEQRIHKL